LGWTEDLLALYATTDFCALSSLNEGTPVAAIEAMAAARPVVATAVGGVPDVVDHGATGLLVAAGDVSAMSDAFVRLAGDAALRYRMGAAGRARALARYSHTRLVDDMERLYAKGLEEKRRR
jgi:glycosyltransferase involved in cell wall biosynthesis